jgi:hypothetical protein
MSLQLEATLLLPRQTEPMRREADAPMTVDRRLTQAKAAEQLGLGIRQLERLCRKLRIEGPRGLASKRRGRISNRKLPDELREQALGLIQSRYSDFGPTLAAEKLSEVHGVVVSVETLRRWMIDAELWVPRSQRRARVHQSRHRRAGMGELIQIDGCDREWFEERAPRCTLLVYVDDATSRLMKLRFAKSESTSDYFEATRSYLERQGKPKASPSHRDCSASVFST